jgi:hypothetical protein
MRGFYRDGGKKLQHRAVTLAVADGITQILEANQKRLRVLMFNAAAAGSTVYVGDAADVDGNDLAAGNGWPLNEDRVITYNPNDTDHYFKFLANVLEIFTQDAVYGLAVGGTGIIKMIEELTD